MKKLSLDAFKEKFNEESKEDLLNELTGGILGQCHCVTAQPNYCTKGSYP